MVNKNQVKGAVKDIAGKVQEEAGKLIGNKNQEIAGKFGCSERKVERKLNLIRLKWETAWPGDAGD